MIVLGYIGAIFVTVAVIGNLVSAATDKDINRRIAGILAAILSTIAAVYMWWTLLT
jgi:hypothetical protein